MVDRPWPSKKTERPCVEYLINRFESETENSVAAAAAASTSQFFLNSMCGMVDM